MNLTKKRILVTGACGFIGSHLVEKLVAENAKVKGFVFYNRQNSWGWLEDIAKEKLRKVEVISGDIRDPYCVRKAMQGVDIVFHLAALIGIPFSYHAPESYLDTNVRGAMNVLQAAKELKTSKVLMTSTSEVYGTARYVPIDEDHPLQGQSPYSATKIAADKLAESFYRSFGLPVTIVRPFNTFGPRQSARAIIPTVITQLLNGEEKIHVGNLHPKRDFLYVKDTVNGFVAIARSDKVLGQEINIATRSEVSIGHLVKKIISLINPRAKIVTDRSRLRPDNSEVERLLGDHKKIKKLTGWRPVYYLEEGLKETINWFKNSGHLESYKHDIFNV